METISGYKVYFPVPMEEYCKRILRKSIIRFVNAAIDI